MAERFYTNREIPIGEFAITGDEARHLVSVCRFGPGDAVTLFNGDGREYPARVIEVSKRHAVLEILGVESPQRELGFRLEVATAVPKGDRVDFLVEKLTELGVSRWVPLRTERSVVHPGEGKLDRLRRTVIEASKQCRRNVPMGIAPLTPFGEYVRSRDPPAARWIAHPGGGPSPGATGDLAIAIGPEGGFSDAEIAMAAGWLTVGLGPRILRVETAAITLAARATAAG